MSSTATDVSVIVPCYKADEWIGECLASIPKDVQLIVVDDPKGKGPAWARNQGLRKATRKYVAFVDSDDYLEFGGLSRMISAMDGVDMVCGSFRKFGLFEATVTHRYAVLPRSGVATYAMSNLLDPRNYQMLSGCWAKLYRREMIGKFPDLPTAEDMALNFDYLRFCKKVTFLEDVVYNNRKRLGSLTMTYNPNDRDGLFGFLEGLKYVKEFLSEFYASGELESALDNSKVYHGMLYFMRICESEGLPMRDVFKRLYP